MNSKEHFKSLDGWRGIAILLVFLFHYLPRDRYNPLSIVASCGWSGVDLFFVLSGFLITGILYDTRESHNFFGAFYARRALRLLPVYCLAISIVIIGTDFLKGFRTWLDFPLFLYGANIVLALPGTVGHFPPNFSCSHFWTLACEEQFYSVWPLLIFLFPSRRTLVKICIGGIALALALRLGTVLIAGAPWVAYMELPTRMDSFLMGGLLALGLRGPRVQLWSDARLVRRVLLASFVGSVLVCVLARSFFSLSIPMSTVGYTLVGIAYSCVLALALIPGTLTQRIGSNRVLRVFGRYSYGLYLFHYLFEPVCTRYEPAFVHSIHPTVLAEMVYALLLLAVFTGMAALSYELFEKRFLRLKRRFVPDSQEVEADRLRV
jgi:peptidoglycan/LPS O-acetylase OafA/YrhL